MNPIFHLQRFPLFLSLALGAALVNTSCCSFPTEVKESVNETRNVVSELHKSHAQDARTFARMVEQREAYFKVFEERLRSAFRDQLTAQVAASKTRTMAEFDRRAGELLGIQFQAQLRTTIVAQFDSPEHAARVALAEARAEHATFTNDPAVTPKLLAKQRDLLNVQSLREGAITTTFLSLDAALKSARAKFETEVDGRYAEELKTALEGIAPTANGDSALAEFSRRMDTQLAELDDAYYAVDHALSDLSTYLDSEATNARFVKHALKGFAGGLVDDLKAGQVAGFELSSLLGRSGRDFTKNLQQLDASMQKDAASAVKDVAGAIKDATGKGPATVAAPTSTSTSASP